VAFDALPDWFRGWHAGTYEAFTMNSALCIRHSLFFLLKPNYNRVGYWFFGIQTEKERQREMYKNTD
jgi:hypothetical protein